VVQPALQVIPTFLHPAVLVMGLVIPIFEVLLGMGLFTKKFRNISILGVVVMHLSILLLLGPFGHNWNSVIWPWNIASIFFAIILFWKHENTSKQIILNLKFKPHIVVVILFGIMPFFNFFGLWDSYLSFALYSGNIERATIVKNNTEHIELNTWAMGELHVFSYPSGRVFKKIAKKVCGQDNNPSDMRLEIYSPVHRFSREERVKVYTCNDL
jgi:hypothetical protein